MPTESGPNASPNADANNASGKTVIGASAEPAGTDLANLPRVKHTIKVYEEGQFLLMDISDETGGLGLKIYWPPHNASQFGSEFADRARAMVSKEAIEPERWKVDTFNPNAERQREGWTVGEAVGDATVAAHCQAKGCGATILSPGGLQLVDGKWRCAAHRTEPDHSSHRNDLRDAHNRAAVKMLEDIKAGRTTLDAEIKRLTPAKPTNAQLPSD